MKGLPPKDAAPPAGPPPRMGMVTFMVDHLGYTQEQAGAEYDRQLALYHAQQAGSPP